MKKLEKFNTFSEFQKFQEKNYPELSDLAKFCVFGESTENTFVFLEGEKKFTFQKIEKLWSILIGEQLWLLEKNVKIFAFSEDDEILIWWNETNEKQIVLASLESHPAEDLLKIQNAEKLRNSLPWNLIFKNEPDFPEKIQWKDVAENFKFLGENAGGFFQRGFQKEKTIFATFKKEGFEFSIKISENGEKTLFVLMKYFPLIDVENLELHREPNPAIWITENGIEKPIVLKNLEKLMETKIAAIIENVDGKIVEVSEFWAEGEK
ncbi:hypothetical protein HN954_00235 [bacterium]|jgi:hypothetical protein|nr:hypothetical protein [bacterium]MBT6832063.1 hypothetical protein [bacterium]MBT6995844.1 hypothetical protein [bacterium]MBT7772345.1 hypothetical protein [bacterium]